MIFTDTLQAFILMAGATVVTVICKFVLCLHPRIEHGVNKIYQVRLHTRGGGNTVLDSNYKRRENV